MGKKKARGPGVVRRRKRTRARGEKSRRWGVSSLVLAQLPVEDALGEKGVRIHELGKRFLSQREKRERGKGRE